MTTKEITAPARQPAAPRVRGIKRPTMKAAYIGNFLDKGRIPRRRKLENNSDVSKYLLECSLSDLGGTPVSGPDPESDERISRMMATEIVAAINRTGSKSSRNWYTDAIRRAVAGAGLLQPEIDSDWLAKEVGGGIFRSHEDARTILFAAMAITSQSVPVFENMRYALEQYRLFLKHGKFVPRGYGVKGSSIKLNLQRFNEMLEVAGGDIAEIRNFLGAEFTMRELKEVGQEFGIRVTAKEMMDENVHGSIVFGPKIGAFYQNLTGQFDSLTMDLWFMRTWGRYTGTLVRDDVQPSQVERLGDALRKDFLRHRAQMEEAGLAIDPTTVDDLQTDELLDACKSTVRFWESCRKRLIDVGFDNSDISVFKSNFDWPGAAESIIKSLSGTVDAPGSGGRRRWMRNVTRRAVQILQRNGYPMTVADAQATLWYSEKSLFAILAKRKPESLNVSYDEAIARIAKSEGFTDDDIAAAFRSAEHGEPGILAIEADAGPGDDFKLQGNDRQADGPGEGENDAGLIRYG